MEDLRAKDSLNGKSVPSLKVLKTPLRDGDLERPDDAAYADSYFINANSASAPGIVDADRQPILERSEVYSGVCGTCPWIRRSCGSLNCDGCYRDGIIRR